MPYLRGNGKLIFISCRDVVVHYTDLINEHTPQLQETTVDDYQGVRAEINCLRKEMSEQLKNFGSNQVDGYFTQAMVSAESDQELYALSNAYETLLLAELKRLKEILHTLRTT